MKVKRGDIYYCDLGLPRGSEQGGIRPVVIIQNDIGNKFSPTTIVAPITSSLTKARIPTHVELVLEKDSIVMSEQIRVVDKCRLKEKITVADYNLLKKIDSAIKVSLNV